MEIRVQKRTLKLLLFGLLLFFVTTYLLKITPLGSYISSQQLRNGNLIAIFLTGLITGGLTCLAVQGGLLAATIAQREEDKINNSLSKTGNAVSIISFLTAKLAAYTVLGFLLGLVGSVIQLSLTATIVMRIIVIIFMLGTALSILNVHPVFRYFVIQPPKFLTRLVRKQSKSKDIFAPALLGAFTVFIPCGTTQAMMALAIASGNPLMGAAILSAFVLGTSPLFFILGYYATKLGNVLQQKFMRIAALALIILAFYNINGVMALSGSSITFDKILSKATCALALCYTSEVSSTLAQQAVTEATITFTQFAYKPDNIVVKAGSTVTLRLLNENGSGCVQAFTLPDYKIQKVVPVGSSDTITFTAPDKPTELSYMCSMGMVTGTIKVI